MDKRIKAHLRRAMYVVIMVEIIVLSGFAILCGMGRWNNNLLMVILLFMAMGTGITTMFILYRSGCKVMEEVKQLSDTQTEADTLMREVVANITHDLKTPITAIKGYSQGILDKVANTPERIYKYVSTIRTKAEDMANLVDELSFFTQIYKSDVQYDFQPVEFNEYMCSCISALSLDLETKKTDLVYQCFAAGEVRTYLDKDKIKRVIHNIVENSLKYIGMERGILLVRIEETQECVIVHIRDNGIGIQKNELPMIFERFYRTDSSRNSSTGGSGLGLAIAKKIIEEHAGQIWAESELGRGTQVSFSLPKIQ